MIRHWNNPFSRFVWKSGMARYVNFSTTICFYGKKQRIPVIKGLGGRNLIPDECWMVDLFKKIPQLTTGTVVDIGANIGQTLLRLRAASPSTPWVGVEPNPICCYYIGELITGNGFDDCRILPIGLSKEPGIVELIKSDDMDAAASIVDYFDRKDTSESVLVPVFPGSEIDSHLKTPPSCIKIDVEGAEALVLEGLLEQLKAWRAPVICEVLDAPTAKRLEWIGERNATIKELLSSVDYQITRIIKDDDTFKGLLPLDEIDCRVTDAESDGRRDYLFLPTKSMDSFSSFVIR